MNATETFQYNVFLSYSSKDRAIAEKLSRRIRSYIPPVKTGLGKKKLSVFRDEERLTASGNLAEALKEKLNNSEFLVLICSPNAAGSPWVNEEVRFFAETQKKEHIIYCLYDGDLTNSLPPYLASAKDEPLYINLRDKSHKNFRNQSLKLIAALHRVDFMTLLRDDEARRRRTTRQIAASALAFIFLLMSISFILSVEPTYWQRVEQPEEYGPNRVMPILPVHDIAINKKDFNEIIFLGKNAEWPDNSPLYIVLPQDRLPDFDSLAGEYLKNNPGVPPLATIDFSINSDHSPNKGEGVIKLWGAAGDSNTVRYIRSIYYRGTDTSNNTRTVSIPASVLPAEESPFDIGKLAELLIQHQLADNSCSITATLTSLVTRKKYPLAYSFDSDELLSDGYDSKESYYGPEYYILATGRHSDTILGRELQDVKYNRRFWDTIAANDQYLTYQQPELTQGLSFVSEQRDEKELAHEVCADLAANKTDTTSLEKALIDVGVEWTEDFLHFNLLTTRSAIGKTDLLKIEGEQFNRHDASTPTFVDWVMRLYPGGPWVSANLPSDAVSGLWPLDATGQYSLLLTNDKGYFFTHNGGKTWEEGNYNETGFANGIYVKTFVLNKNTIYALIDRGEQASDPPNPLFRLQKRNWWQRWRIGLIQLLK